MTIAWLGLAMTVVLAAGANAQPTNAVVAEEIRREATRPNASAEGRPLPLACSWQCGSFRDPSNAGWRPENQLQLIEQGHHLLPWLSHPLGPLPADPGDFFFAYYEQAMRRAQALHLPLTLIASQWESGLSEPPYLDLPPEQNPNVVTAEGKILPKVCPFGPIQPWREIGRQHTDNPQMRQLQEWYPDPPLVIFLSNNEHARLQWHEAETSQRYLDRYGRGRDDDFKRRVVGEGWIERYRALQDGMREGLISPQWREKAIFVGYSAFGPPHLGRWAGWPTYSLHCPGWIDPSPLMWDGGSPSYYTHNWNPSTDYTTWSPQVEFQNLVFMLEEAHRLNPGFWFELSVWDGYSPGRADDKRLFYANLGQDFTPERYQGFVQFGMWLMRPRAVREFRGWTQPWEENRPYFMAIVEAVDRVYKNPTLREWWCRGKLVPNRAHPHPYQHGIPEKYRDADRWFLLDASVNPQQFPWELSQPISVFCLALAQGEAPRRQWLLYAHSPLGPREDVRITIPDYREVIVDVPVSGAFYVVDEATGELRAVND